MTDAITTLGETEEAIEMLEDAQWKMQEAETLILQALGNTPNEAHAKAYLLGHLSDMASNNPTDRNCSVQYYLDELHEEFDALNDETFSSDNA